MEVDVKNIEYEDFLSSKRMKTIVSGLDKIPNLHPSHFQHQRDVTQWALRLGRSAAFLGTGMGKTLIELDWARVISEHTDMPVLILAPLSVAEQTVGKESPKFGFNSRIVKHQNDVGSGINVANYERIDSFDPSKFAGIVCDESSILKSMDGKTRSVLIDMFRETPYKLCATATPAPNDYMELGNHAEFLGVMTATEMLSMFFVHDGGETQKWRLKGHARKEFWKWVCTWAVSMRKPSDIGYSDDGFILPSKYEHFHTVEVDTPTDGFLFALPAETLQERIGARRASIEERIALTTSIIMESWTNKRSTTTTENTKMQIESASTLSVVNDTQPTLSAKLPKLKHGERQTQKSALNRSESTGTQTESDCVNICENDTVSIPEGRRNTTENDGLRNQTKKGIGISEPSMESVCRNTRLDLNLKMVDARFADPISPEESQNTSRLTTAIKANQLEGCSAQAAIKDLGDSKMTLLDSKQPQHTFKTQWVAWCNLNSEQDELAKALGDDCVSIYGSLSPEEKLSRYNRFERGEVAVLVTKISIFGYGINMQFCSNQIFVGVNDSFEMFFQAVRRQWRFGQKRPVHIHILAASTEGNVVDNLKRKEIEAEKMADEMAENTQDLTRMNLVGTTRNSSPYVRDLSEGDRYEMHLADCVDLAKEIDSDSIHYSIYSPPFETLYTYSNSDRDMGNSRTSDEFWSHYRFLIAEQFRITMPGRLISIHCMNLPTSKQNHGYIGLRDFRGEIIKVYEEFGFIYHSEVCIWKDPVTAMQRTKALGLLHKQIRKDSSMSRQGIPDYLVTMRKPGENTERISHTAEEFPVSLWQRFASPVWMDINPSDTLQRESAREHEDERHICPLQLEVIRRGIRLWSNVDDTVYDPFAGIGSTGVVALEMGRKFIGSELKKSYWVQASANLENEQKRANLLF